MNIWVLFFAFLVIGNLGDQEISVEPCEAESDSTGCITGVVTDQRCGTALSYVNVVLRSTNIGSMTNGRGRFTIEHVPPGIYKVLVLMMGYERTTVESVEVKSGETTELSVSMEEMGSTELSIMPDKDAGTCEVHKIQMHWVLVPIGYGLRVTDPNWEKAKLQFPNAEPTNWSGCSPGRKSKTWAGRCSTCVSIRNQRINDIELESEKQGEPYLWTEFFISDSFFIRMPDTTTVRWKPSICGGNGGWATEEFKISVYYGPLAGELEYARTDVIYRSREIINGSYPAIDVFPATEFGKYVVVGRFSVTPFGTNILLVRITIKDIDRIDVARNIVRSVVFDRKTGISK